MKRTAKTLLLAAIFIVPLFVTGCVYVPARGYRADVWVPAHWGGPRGDVWIGGHWR